MLLPTFRTLLFAGKSGEGSGRGSGRRRLGDGRARPATRRADAYPWAHWEHGEWWLIKRGDQFRCTPAGMRSTLRSRAAREAKLVEVVLRPDDPQIPAGKEHQYIAFRFRNLE